MISILREFYRRIFNLPEDYVLDLANEGLKPGISIENEVDVFISGSQNRMFILGNWGSGKTHHTLRTLKSKKISCSYYSLFGIRSLEEGYRHLIPSFVRF